MSAVTVLGALVVLRWGLLLLAASLLLRSAKSCPACLRSTVPIRRPLLSAVLRFAEWRWCPSCGWQGLSRVQEPERRWTRTSSRSGV